MHRAKHEKLEMIRLQPKKLTRPPKTPKARLETRQWREKLARDVIAFETCCECLKTNTLFDDELNGVRVCTACGRVNKRVVYGAGQQEAHYSVAPRVSPPYARTVHFQERLSQWTSDEPPIESPVVDSLRDAYARLGSPNRISKETVARIIETAGAEKKKYLEKWQTIRETLTGVQRVMPRAELVAEIKREFGLVNAVWQSVPAVRRGRRNIINLNFIFMRLLLRQGMAVYWTHIHQFPQILESKQADLMTYWRDICRELEWPVAVRWTPVACVMGAQ